MARPLKKGIDYFPLEVSIEEDDKFFDLFEEFGTDKGLGLVILLLSYIYKNEGYYTKWNDSICKKFARKKQLDRTEVKKAVEILTGTCKEYSEPDDEELFFNRELFKNEGVLSSSSIQKRFFLAAERRKDKEIIKQYFLLEYEFDKIKTGTKKEGIHFLDIFEDTFFITIEKKKIPFRFVIHGHITDNDSTNIVNVNINEINDSNSTHIRREQNKPEETKPDQIENKEEKNKIKKEEKKEDFQSTPYTPPNIYDNTNNLIPIGSLVDSLNNKIKENNR